MAPRSENIPVRLQVAPSDRPVAPSTIHQYQPIEVADIDDQHSRYLLATDDDGRVVGVLARDQILERLQSGNDQERARWGTMPVGSLMNVVFADTTRPGTSLRDGLECMAITEDGGLIGLAIEDDVFLSWERLEPMLTVAITDPLTGLMNRLAYDRRLNEEWHRAVRTGTPVGVLVADLDGLKPINDSQGHQAGDFVLKRVGGLLEESLRSYDILARYGGDEFVGLCIGCRPGEITIPIHRIQQRLQTEEFRFEGEDMTVALSIGAAVRHDDFVSSTPAELFRAADQCMYLAKGSREAAFTVEFGGSATGIPLPLSRCEQPIPGDRGVAPAVSEHDYA